MNDPKRLHITPLNPSLLPVVLAGFLREKAIDISFHTICTFPEKSYGYITLPFADAERLQKKLHGSLVRGQKMKVEDARPKRSSGEITAPDESIGASAKKSRSRKSKTQEQGVLPGLDLPDGRKVKRGWTVSEGDSAGSAKKSGQKKSRVKQASITGDAECLFKTKVPSTPTNIEEKHDRKLKKRKRAGNGKECVIHEFQRATRASVATQDQSSYTTAEPATEYIEGKGWVDQDGIVVEKARKRRQSYDDAHIGSEHGITIAMAVPSARAQEDLDGGEKSSASSASASSEEVEADDPPEGGLVLPRRRKISSKPRREEQGQHPGTKEEEKIQTAQVERLSISRSSGSPTPHVDTQPTSAPAGEINPLKALFKRPHAAASHSQTPKKPHLEVSTTFSFFDPDTEAPNNEDAGMLMPQTPYTQQDFRHRRQRSAAPTPDTALPGKSFGDILGTRGDDEADSDGSGNGSQVTPGAIADNITVAGGDGKQAEKQETKDAKWFWEHRGEANRSYRRQKREATKGNRMKDRKAKKA